MRNNRSLCWGQQRRFEHTPSTSALPPIPNVCCPAANDVQGHFQTRCIAAKIDYSITSSALPSSVGTGLADLAAAGGILSLMLGVMLRQPLVELPTREQRRSTIQVCFIAEMGVS